MSVLYFCPQRGLLVTTLCDTSFPLTYNWLVLFIRLWFF
ncbi:hypothetical protein BAZSYMA_ACONTIG19398_0 [Bathymodiolus azoricus thioautotrophic gill symbiont]|uniref:Uncharacterized protein n=1 Tax=Bathymodiolus azoricus thioautotrophic gill symbiont TaxID=235205 RepID=A0A1H6KE53_9GAMM|nr:hypothetical protein BAZSYMA_ACONTIG19398_0 [Bathymodiolus azoricus thioautotrophic gill symbiont]